MTTYKLLKSMKKVATDIRVVKKDVSIKEEIECAINELMEKSHNESFFFQSRAIKTDSRSYYKVYLPVSKENFRKEFFINWGYVMNELIAIQIKIGADNVLIVKE